MPNPNLTIRNFSIAVRCAERWLRCFTTPQVVDERVGGGTLEAAQDAPVLEARDHVCWCGLTGHPSRGVPRVSYSPSLPLTRTARCEPSLAALQWKEAGCGVEVMIRRGVKPYCIEVLNCQLASPIEVLNCQLASTVEHLNRAQLPFLSSHDSTAVTRGVWLATQVPGRQVCPGGVRAIPGRPPGIHAAAVQARG